ncbi:MYCBP-associated protein-like isoform X3 [Gigantopelta aegis]|uniref:MYCBP-associated protein-like isoform X3 n=1 Tax=Gigantopelta aegis TaxID=1735272 RepID=UPI001B889EE0|nr:MYCBP-associated protein-like isoform X3 [Gigantopelta aegis]
MESSNYSQNTKNKTSEKQLKHSKSLSVKKPGSSAKHKCDTMTSKSSDASNRSRSHSKPRAVLRLKKSVRILTVLHRLRKGKRDGTPEKSRTPSQEAALDENRSPSRTYIWNEEIEKLQIKEDELKKLYDPKPPSESRKTPVVASVVVRKMKPATEWDKPKPKIVTVAKPAPPNAPVKPLDYSGYAGPRYHHDGSVVPHSILGSYKDFHREAVKRGDLMDLPFPRPDDAEDEVPTVKYEKKPKQQKTGQMKANENNALINWQMKMRERKQGYISKLLQKNPEDLAMNQADNFRNIQEKRYIIDRTIPLMDYGKGYRVGSEFWNQQEQFGDDIKGIHMTLSQTQRGYPPPVEHVGIPQSVRKEKGWTWSPNYSAPVHYPWHKAPYYETRRKQLQKVIDDLDNHEPDFDGLEVIGQNPSRDVCSESFNSQFGEEKRMQGTPPAEQDPLRDYPDVHTPPIFGPSLLFAGQPARWVGNSHSFRGEIGIEARVTFESYTGDRVMSYLEIVNDGTTSVYYDWKQIPRENPFDLVQARIQRFYFNNSSGVILPGETMKFPFVFKSPNAGVFTEQWKFETRPVIIGGADLIVTLRGVALQEDVYQPDRILLEQELFKKQAYQISQEILMELVNSIQIPVRPPSPIDAYITEEEIFTRNNYGLYYHHETVESLKEMYIQLYPEEERDGKFWDLCIQDLKELVGELDEDDERKEAFITKINESVAKMSFSPKEPIKDRLYSVGYQLLVETVDEIVGQSMLLRQVLGLPEKEWDDMLESDLNTRASKGATAPRKQIPSVGESDSESKRGKPLDKSKPDPKDKKGAPGKDPKAAKGGKETPKGDSKVKTGSAMKKTPTRGTSITPAPVVTPTGELTSSPDSPPPSPILDVDPLVEKKYKEKLYTQAYLIVSETMEKMDSALGGILDKSDQKELKLKSCSND